MFTVESNSDKRLLRSVHVIFDDKYFLRLDKENSTSSVEEFFDALDKYESDTKAGNVSA